MISRKGIAHPMITSRKSTVWFTLLIVTAVLFSVSCELEEPTSIWDLPDDPAAGDTPVITSIMPTDSSMAGVGEIQIAGEDFSDEMGANVVFFNDTQAEVVSDSETEIVILTPELTGDNLAVRVARQGAYLFSDAVSYRVIPSVVTHAELGPSEIPNSLGTDRDEFTYVSLATGYIRKVDRTGAAEDIKVPFLNASLKVGPDFDIYALWNLRSRGQLYRYYLDTTLAIECDTTWITDTTWTEVTCDTTEDVFYAEDIFVTFNTERLEGLDFDFDSDGNLWVGASTSLMHVTPDGSKTTADSYSDNVRGVRVVDGDVYVLEGSNVGSQKIIRSPITGAGTLGAQSVVLDFGTEADMAGVTVFNFTLSDAGDIYLATDDSESGLIVYYADTDVFERFYPRMIGTPLKYLSWGNGPFLYASYAPAVGSPAVLKIDVRKERAMQFSAPYYGREF